MRYKFIIIFLILGFVSKAQVYQLMPQYGYSTYRMNFDSTIQIPTFCGVPKLGSNKINKGALAFDSCNNRFYYFNPKTQIWDTIKSADASLFVKYTDTAQMLSAYLRKTDTISLSNRIEGKIDSLKLSNDSIYARKNNQFVFQYMNDTATVVKAFVRNVESFTINRGQVVYIFGASGDKASVKLADNSGDYTSSRTLGIVRENIAAGQTGWVTTQGQVAKLQLGSYNEGDVLWLDSIPGGFTKTKPVAPRHSVFLGIVERANNGNGIAYVKPQNGYEIGELHDVKITSPATNQVLAYTTNIWENKNIYSIVDTLGLSNRINTKLNISDTSAMLSPYLRSIDTTNKYVTSVFRKTASDSVFFVRGGSNNFAFRDSVGTLQIGTLTNGTAGSVVYLGTNGALRQSNTQFFFDSTQASLNLGTNTNVGSAILNLSSTTKGFLRPRLTTTQMNAISTPATGLSVFNTTDSVPYIYRGTVGGWQKNVIYSRTNDVALFNGANQRIMIDTVSNVTAGRQLTVEAGSTIAGGTSAFQRLNQTNNSWEQLNAASNGDIYAMAGDRRLYRRTGGTGNFNLLLSISATGYGTGVCIAPNGDIYASIYSSSIGDIYKSTNNGVSFSALGQTPRNWGYMAAAPNGDIYAVVDGGDIYKQTGGTGNFIALSAGNRAWRGITVTPNGDIYASSTVGVFRSTNNGTSFSLTNAISLYGITSTTSGEIYGSFFSGNIWKSSDNGVTFISLNQTVRSYTGIAAAPNGDIYVGDYNADVYIQTQGTANLNGGTLVLQSGVGKGTGTSTINFNTGTTLTSGSTLQTASTKMTILGNGNVGIGTTSPSAKLELSDTARGFLQTRMTTTQRNNIASPSVGLQVFTTTDSSQYVYRGTGAGWQQIANEIVNTASLNFPSTNAQNSSDLTITLTGAVDGDAVVLGVPNAAVNANSCYTAWVSASGVVTVRLNNYGTTAIDPAQATFKVTIIK